MRLAWMMVLVGCGRLGFETSRDGALDDGGALVDGPTNNPDAMDRTETFGEDPSADHTAVTTDTFISQSNGAANNFGGADNIRIESDNADRGLLRIVVTAIPMSATVLDARLRIFLEDFAVGSTISVHAVNESWDEGNADGTTGFANFQFRRAAIPWSLTGASAPASIGPTVVTFSGGALGVIEVPLPATLVQAWVSTPAANFGILFESDSEATVRVVSSEGQDAQRPLLSVTYE